VSVRHRNRRNSTSCSRDAPSHPSFATPVPTQALPEGRRSAERRKLHGPHQRVRRAPRRQMLPPDRASGARAFRRSTAVSLRRINASAQLQPRFLGSASSGVTRIFPCPSPASSSQAGRYYRPGGVRSRPGAGLRAPPAGTALASVIRPSPVTPFEEASWPPSNYTGDICQGLVA
jgi:hypothetical protein